MIPRSRSTTSPPRWQPRPDCYTRCSPNATDTHAPGRARTAKSTRPVWLAACPASRISADRSSSPRWATRPGSADGAAFKRFSGLTPKASETGDTDRKGQKISKAGPRRLRDQLVQSANTARRVDPQLAHVYFTQIVERGAHHQKALCVVAARLAERAWIVMARGEPYELRDVNGTPVSAAEAKAIIADRYQVTEEVRRRRRSRKNAGKAPQQVLEAHIKSRARSTDKRGDLPRATTQPRTRPAVKNQASTPPTPPHATVV